MKRIDDAASVPIRAGARVRLTLPNGCIEWTVVDRDGVPAFVLDGVGPDAMPRIVPLSECQQGDLQVIDCPDPGNIGAVLLSGPHAQEWVRLSDAFGTRPEREVIWARPEGPGTSIAEVRAFEELPLPRLVVHEGLKGEEGWR